MDFNDLTNRIFTKFSNQYDLDIDEILEDTKKISSNISSVNNGELDSLSIYLEPFSPADTIESAQIPDLEDLQYEDITPDTRLDARRVEQNIDEAIGYLETCFALKKEYGDIAKIRNEIKFKFEDFVRQDLVHTHEVNAGLYKHPWMDADDELTGVKAAISEASEQKKIASILMGTEPSDDSYYSTLSDASISEYLNSASFVTKYSARHHPEKVEKASRETFGDAKNTEKASWLQKLSALNENITQLKSRKSILTRKKEYLLKDEGFRAQRAAIKRNIALKQISEYSRKHSPTNFDEALRNIKTLFNQNFSFLLQRLIQIELGIKEFYNINIELERLNKGNNLENAALWLSKIRNELQLKNRDKIAFIFSKAVDVENLGAHPTDSTVLTFESKLKISNKDLPYDRQYLRGISVELIGDYTRPISIEIVPPKAVSTFSNSIQLGRVSAYSLGLNLSPNHSDSIWNGSALGDWKIIGDINKEHGEISGVIFHFWLVSFPS